MILRPLLIGLAALSLGACATVQRYDAAGDIHAFLVSIRDNDQKTFDDHVDRPALKAQLKARFMAEMIKRGGVLGAGLSQMLSGLTDALVDGALHPSVFLAVAEANGYAPSKPLPSRVSITSALRKLEDDRVCVIAKKDGPCVLVFRREGELWRLVAFEGAADQLQLPRP